MSLSLPILVNRLLNGAHRWANITAPENTKWEQLFQIGGLIRKKRPREKEEIWAVGGGPLSAGDETRSTETRFRKEERRQSSVALVFLVLFAFVLFSFLSNNH